MFNFFKKRKSAKPEWTNRIDETFKRVHNALEEDETVPQLRSNSELLTALLDDLPENVHIRSVRPKAHGSKWAVKYRDNGTVYYGQTLLEALEELYDKNKAFNRKLDDLHAEELRKANQVPKEHAVNDKTIE